MNPGEKPPAMVDLLLAVPGFARLDGSLLASIESELELVRVHGGEVLFDQGDPGDSLFVVVSGRLRATVADDRDDNDNDGRERVVGEIAQGETVGEMALVTGEKRSATVRAIRDSELVKLPAKVFERLVDRHPRVLAEITRTVVTRLKATIHSVKPRPRLATVAVVAASPEVALAEFCQNLVRALASYAPVLHLNHEQVQRAVGITIAEPGAPRELVSWLNEQESKYRLVVYEADPTLSPWSDLSVRQADRVLVLGDGTQRQPAPESATCLRLRQAAVAKHLVLLRPPGYSPAGAQGWVEELAADTLQHAQLGVAADIERVARRLLGRAVGLVLSGGGARGFAHIGVLKALREADVTIDYVGGTSMGSFVAAQAALGWDSQRIAAEARRFWIDEQPLRDFTVPIVAVISGRKMLRMLRRLFGEVEIADTLLPFFAVSADLSRARPRVHESGPLWRSVRASMSIPGVAPPLLEDGSLCVDGAFLNNLPADVMSDRCRGQVIAVDVGRSVDWRLSMENLDTVSAGDFVKHRLNPFKPNLEFPGMLEILMGSALLSSGTGAQEVERYASCIIQPPLAEFGLFEWPKIDEIIQIGYQAAATKLADWQPRTGAEQ